MFKPTASRKWQAKFRNWIGGNKYGILIAGVRRRGRGEWITLEQVPQEVRDYLYAQQTDGAGRWYCSEFQTIDQLKAEVDGVVVGRAFATLHFVVDEQVPPPRLRSIHRAVRAALRAIGQDNLASFARAIYRSTSTGIGVGFRVEGEWIYGSGLPTSPLDDLLKTQQITGFSATGYCEGVDCDFDPRICEGKVTQADIWGACDAAEQDGLNVWNDTHGCESCGPEQDGYRPINPHCATCHGDGVII